MRELAVIFALILVPIWVIGCDCIVTPLNKQIKASEYVLKVKVTTLLDNRQERIDFHYLDENDNRSYRATVEVMTVYKGNTHESTIELATNFTNCEPYYELGVEYLLFIKKVDNRYFVIPCTSWTKLSKSTRTALKKVERLTRK